MSQPIHDGAINDQCRSLISIWISDRTNLLIGRGKENGCLDEVLSARTQRKGVPWTGRVEKGVESVCECVGGVCGFAVCSCLQG